MDAGHPTPNYFAAGAVLALKRTNQRAPSHGGALPREAQMDELFEAGDKHTLDKIRAFVAAHDLVELPDGHYYIVEALWPEFLHKVKPPRDLMH